MIKEREAGRALIISLTKKAVERFEMTKNVLAKLDGYKAAFDQTISLARAHGLIMDEMEDKAGENWKKVRKGSLEKRGEVVERWTKEYAKVIKAYEEDVVRVYTDAGLQSDGETVVFLRVEETYAKPD
jgi:hypothetical protein